MEQRNLVSGGTSAESLRLKPVCSSALTTEAASDELLPSQT